jgi:gamma-tubulin complex component 3
MEKYLRIFNFLWRLKRIDHSLSQNWSLQMAHWNDFSLLKGMKGNFHKFNVYRHEMVHFVANIHNYIMVEVLDSAWSVFQEDIKQAKDLD